MRRLIGIFNLPGDFRFTNHHGIQTAGHREQMFHRLSPFLDIDVRRHIQIGTKLLEDAKHLALNPGRRRAIDFDAVAGGNQHDLLQAGVELQPAAKAGQSDGRTASRSRTSTGAVL